MFSPAIKLPSALAKTMIKAEIKYIKSYPYILYFDGCSKGNPGPGGAGAALYKNNVEIWSDNIFVGDKVTNNTAEYSGLILGLTYASKLPDITSLLVKGDSLLVIKQMRGEYKVKSEHLLELYNSAKSLALTIPDIEFQHIYRDQNKRADILSNEGLVKPELV
jgi:ribonuclease HI